MKQCTITFVAILLLASFASTLAANAPTNNLQSCIPDGQYDPTVNYFPVRTVVTNSTLFNVTYTNSYKVVTDVTSNDTYVLYQCGSPKPDASLFAKGAKFFSVPVNTVLTTQTTSNPYLLLLGLQSKIKYVDSAEYISSPCVQMALEKGDIKPHNTSVVPSQIDSVDVAFISSFERDNRTNTVITRESHDPGPLHRAGWIQFYAFFFNAENVSKTVFGGISDNYHCFANSSRITLQDRETTLQRVAWTSYYSGTWSIDTSAYKAKITADGGAALEPKLSTKNVTEFLEALTDVDVLIDETYLVSNFSDFLSIYKIDPSTADQYKFVKNKRVFREDGLINPIGGRDWFESAVSYDDAVLQDFIRITYPIVIPKTVKPLWFRNLALNESQIVLTSADCTNYDDIVHIYKDRVLRCATMPLNLSSSSVLLPTILFTLFATIFVLLL